MSQGGKEAVRADDEVVVAPERCAASKNACANWNGCWP
jgi:hypothetical protein